MVGPSPAEPTATGVQAPAAIKSAAMLSDAQKREGALAGQVGTTPRGRRAGRKNVNVTGHGQVVVGHGLHVRNLMQARMGGRWYKSGIGKIARQ